MPGKRTSRGKFMKGNKSGTPKKTSGKKGLPAFLQKKLKKRGK